MLLSRFSRVDIAYYSPPLQSHCVTLWGHPWKYRKNIWLYHDMDSDNLLWMNENYNWYYGRKFEFSCWMKLNMSIYINCIGQYFISQKFSPLRNITINNISQMFIFAEYIRNILYLPVMNIIMLFHLSSSGDERIVMNWMKFQRIQGY